MTIAEKLQILQEFKNDMQSVFEAHGVEMPSKLSEVNVETLYGQGQSDVFNDPKEEGKTFTEYVYAVNEKHAKQIFLAANDGCVIKSIEYYEVI